MTTRLTVTGTEQRTPVLRRVWFASDDLGAFAASAFTDRYVKLVIPAPGAGPLPDGDLDVRALRRTLPADQLPAVRTYTALRPDVDAGTLAIDFVVHGTEGVAGPWAAAARPGDVLAVNGPGGAYAPDPTADWHLLVGDESALPALTAALEALAPDAVARVVVRVARPGDEPDDLPLTDRSEVTWVHGAPADGPRLAEAVRALDWPAGRVHAFVHGEAGEVMHDLRPHLLGERGVPRSDLSISGYWRAGRTEEGFRDWKAEQRRAEEQAAAPPTAPASAPTTEESR